MQSLLSFLLFNHCKSVPLCKIYDIIEWLVHTTGNLQQQRLGRRVSYRWG